jgi:protein transport protein SEC61 subunit gamma-like protein
MGRNKQKKSYNKYLDWNKYKRVIKLSKTPDKEEYIKVSKIVVSSVILVGLIGYLIFALMNLIPM